MHIEGLDAEARQAGGDIQACIAACEFQPL